MTFKKVWKKLKLPYHLLMAFFGAVLYRSPSRSLNVIGVTGTKGKTSTAEILNAILEEAGYKTALASTLRFKIGEQSKPNMFKMTLPGRFFIQKFLREAISKKCTHVVIEITSEAQVQYRNRYVFLDGLIFTNISPEHIESHGSFEKYLEAKLAIAKSLETSGKEKTILVVNGDDPEASKFLAIHAKEKHAYTLKDAGPWKTSADGSGLTFQGTAIHTKLSGKFNIYNVLAAATYANALHISPLIIQNAVEKIDRILGRVEKITLDPSHPFFDKQDFTVVVDYAHTADSLQKLYEVFENSRKICVLGNTGGGRDVWKRSEMAKIADTDCDSIILTNEDPYNDDPKKIVEEMAKSITKKPLKIILDRREAIREALSQAKTGDIVLVTGKGTDPYIMEARGKKTPWSDASVVREELEKKFIDSRLPHA